MLIVFHKNKCKFFIKTRRNGDHDDLEWPMLSNYVIYCEKFRNVLQRTQKVALTVTMMTEPVMMNDNISYNLP